MPIISIIGPKGGIGKTTLSINTAAALTRVLPPEGSGKRNRVCLVDLDLRLPTISSILNSHPQKTFYDLFETLANKTYQADYLQSIYRILVTFKGYLDGEIPSNHRQLARSLALYKNMGTGLFHFSSFKFGDHLHELFLHRGKIESPADLKILIPIFNELDISALRGTLRQAENNSRPMVEEYINFIEEYGFSIIGGEVPILGKKNHRKRINEPAFLVLFLEFLNEVFEKFDYIILDTPAGGVSHLASLMNSIDQVLLVFDMSNKIAINGSIDALHTFIDYYENFYDEFTRGRLTGLDKAYVNRLMAARGREAIVEALENKKIGILFNRCEGMHDISSCLNRLRDYLETLEKFEKYKDRIHIAGMMPQHKIIKITNNRGALFYDKDLSLRSLMDLVAQGIIKRNTRSPTLACPNGEILQHLQRKGRGGWVSRFARLAGCFT